MIYLLNLTFSAAFLINSFERRSQMAGTVITQCMSSSLKTFELPAFILFSTLSLKYLIAAANTSTAGSSFSVISFNVKVSERFYREKKTPKNIKKLYP